MEVIQTNSIARNLSYNAINGEEYDKISPVKQPKKCWDKLEVTSEGADKIKQTIVNLLVYD